MADYIYIKGAREHNLKNIDVKIPRDKLVVITGLSGSGKSSLAFDTIYAEGQRRYVESLSAYARQFLGQMNKPDVDYIEGLSPAISIDQKTTSKNPRSTVGTITEIHDYMRLLYARIGIPHCPQCGRVISQQTVDQMIDRVLSLGERTRIQVLAPVVRGRKGEYVKLINDIRKAGYVRLRIDGNIYDIGEEIKLDKNKKHNIDVVVDRLIVREDIRSRLADSIETALELADGLVVINVLDGEDMLFSQNLACPDCGISIEELTPRMFSFNSPYGACPDCSGLGFNMKVDPELLLDMSKSILDGAINTWIASEDSWTYKVLLAVAKEYGIDLNTPLQELGDKLNILLYGIGAKKVRVKGSDGRYYEASFEGIINNLERRYHETQSQVIKEEIEKYMRIIPCDTCKGTRLKKESLSVTVGGKSIAELSDMSIIELKRFFETLELSEKHRIIANQILKEINARLGFLIDVGLDYLTLSRSAGTLSGGEAQRIRLASQIGSGLMGVLYILDEPSIGLHQKDNDKLIKTLKHLRDLGNTLIVVEHDEDTMYASDYIIDVGPGAGENGGRIVAAGTIDEIKKCKESITGQYLSGIRKIEVPSQRRKPNGKWLIIKGARENNLKNIDVEIPLGVITCVTGVSGSGKSTLVNEILYKSLARQLNKAKEIPGDHDCILGVENLDKVINIDQSPIGRTPRSNPATYTGVFDYIREVFSLTPEAKMRGYKQGRFSFNVKGGRCEACHGDGIIKIEMHFLSDVYVPCEVCKGKRYNRETLEIKYKGKNIADVLDMTVDEALEFFENIPRIKNKLMTLHDVGLGYIRLGQPSTQLSGGEAQRIKLATELSRKATGRTIYILDEPTTGLHMADVEKLIEVLNRLVEGGNSIIVIEHNMDVIKTADYIIDLGPDGGDRGGRVVACGTPEEVAMNENSYTGQYLKKILFKEKSSIA
ncbi:Excinuclease ABC subunit A [Caldanaerobius fijiensis DSM 17918]|uniref:UvrABC system protein A n=1 Tax=Caldanaerobius fijiensis DSM 17918 TaxID=1121256 RepID=A0A1M5B1W2_9THEO|nr:excinuclease ABC subunit UvrA [Caldanaerobius fijiensis]SHF36396.1 Excinuclease ABC subunit A [Caldanaerobius fijiensis DSM 17918]